MDLETALSCADAAVKDAQRIRDQIADAIANTVRILDAAEKLGVALVGIGERDDRFKQSKGFPFSKGGNIFADGRSQHDRPVAWAIADASVGMGCGNSGQAQISVPTINGIYALRDGRWLREGEVA